MRYHSYQDGDWIRPAPRAYLRCCDCGLVHRIQFRLVDGHIEFRVWRLPRRASDRQARPTFDAADAYGHHAPTCAREIIRQADDSAAYLYERCTCGAAARGR